MDEEHHHHHLQFQLELNPVFICLIGILCGLAIVAILHCIAMGWCRCCCQRRPRIIRRTQEQEYPSIPNIINVTADSEGGDHQLITVYKHKEGKESTCAVCLGEFAEGEAIRALPECAHSFHVPCIDVWLRSNPSCPLCRAGTGPPPQPSPHVAVCLSSSGGVPPPPEILYL